MIPLQSLPKPATRLGSTGFPLPTRSATAVGSRSGSRLSYASRRLTFAHFTKRNNFRSHVGTYDFIGNYKITLVGIKLRHFCEHLY